MKVVATGAAVEAKDSMSIKRYRIFMMHHQKTSKALLTFL
jgi:hypothetical protein